MIEEENEEDDDKDKPKVTTLTSSNGSGLFIVLSSRPNVAITISNVQILELGSSANNCGPL